MMVDVHLADHRTVLRIATRSRLMELTRRDLGRLDAYGALRVWADHGRGEGWRPRRMHFISRSAIAWIEHVDVRERDEFLEEHDPRLLDHLRAKERAALADTTDGEAAAA